MLAALLTILLLGRGSSVFLDYIDDSQGAIKTVMVKDERRKEALNVVEAIEKRSKGHDKQVRKTIKELGKLLEGRENNSKEIAAMLERHFADLESYNSDILDLRFDLKEQVTREEWIQIFPDEENK